jgi:hypothetical protein
LKDHQSDQILMSPSLASLDLPDTWTPNSSCQSIPDIHKSCKHLFPLVCKFFYCYLFEKEESKKAWVNLHFTQCRYVRYKLNCNNTNTNINIILFIYYIYMILLDHITPLHKFSYSASRWSI